MPSSLIFVALAAAWLVVLVPMVAKRRQEVVRTADSALASRVLERPAPRRVDRGEERRIMTERAALDSEPELPEAFEPPELPKRRGYRPGRGGYDPEAAELAANARYALRQRIVIALAIGAAVTLVGAIVAAGMLWIAHIAMDACLLGYLGYLRRQVRIEEDVRNRRVERFEAKHGPVRISEPLPEGVEDVDELDDYDDYDEYVEYADDEADDAEPDQSRVRTRVEAPRLPGAAAVELDDEDPYFDDLRPRFEPPYRRAVGE